MKLIGKRKPGAPQATLAQRTMFGWLVKEWRNLSPTDQQTWIDADLPQPTAITRFAATNVTRWRGDWIQTAQYVDPFGGPAPFHGSSLALSTEADVVVATWVDQPTEPGFTPWAVGILREPDTGAPLNRNPLRLVATIPIGVQRHRERPGLGTWRYQAITWYREGARRAIGQQIITVS